MKATWDLSTSWLLIPWKKFFLEEKTKETTEISSGYIEYGHMHGKIKLWVKFAEIIFLVVLGLYPWIRTLNQWEKMSKYSPLERYQSMPYRNASSMRVAIPCRRHCELTHIRLTPQITLADSPPTLLQEHVQDTSGTAVSNLAKVNPHTAHSIVHTERQDGIAKPGSHSNTTIRSCRGCERVYVHWQAQPEGNTDWFWRGFRGHDSDLQRQQR